ncbi:hypothetical protein JHK85_016421 [Glycine max]|nr:hypothetical protein JHK85_016421 [Glycine max]
MVFPKLVITIVLILVLFFFIYESEGASYSSGSYNVGHGADINTPYDHQKVNLSVYYDSLCQSCATFIVKDLLNVFYNNLISIVNLQLVPWANAYVNNTNNSISCQFHPISGHVKEYAILAYSNGPDECELNSLESCALNLWHKVDIRYYLINCFEYLVIGGKSMEWVNCLSQLGLPKEPIMKCFNMGNGAQDYANFAHYVCKAYKGAAVPEVCNPPSK